MKSQQFISSAFALALCASCTSNTASNSQSSGAANNSPPVIEDAGLVISPSDPVDTHFIELVTDVTFVDASLTQGALSDTSDGSTSPTAVADAARVRPSTRPGTRPNSTAGTAGTATPATPSTSNTDAAEGQVIFARTCGRCHPGGNARIGPRLAARADAEAHVRTVVRNGEGTMRPIPSSRVSDSDLVKVFAYLRSIRAVR